jgi:hypothetical protein
MKILFETIFGLVMKNKNSLHYELYGSSAGAEKKGYWRWAIFTGREKKPLLVGSFYGTFEDAKGHAEAAILRLKERARKRKASPSK